MLKYKEQKTFEGTEILDYNFTYMYTRNDNVKLGHIKRCEIESIRCGASVEHHMHAK